MVFFSCYDRVNTGNIDNYRGQYFDGFDLYMTGMHRPRVSIY